MPSPEWEVKGHCLWWEDPAGVSGKELVRGEQVFLNLPFPCWADNSVNASGTCFDTSVLWGQAPVKSPSPSGLASPYPVSSLRPTCDTHGGLCDLSPRALNGMHPIWRSCRAQGESAPLVFPCPSRQLRSPLPCCQGQVQPCVTCLCL